MEQLIRQLIEDNRQARARMQSFAARTVAAIQTGAADEFANIVADVSAASGNML